MLPKSLPPILSPMIVFFGGVGVGVGVGGSLPAKNRNGLGSFSDDFGNEKMKKKNTEIVKSEH